MFRSGTAYARPKIFDDSSIGESENDTNDETNDESGTVIESTEDDTEGDVRYYAKVYYSGSKTYLVIPFAVK